jgi:hypothetical protein
MALMQKLRRDSDDETTEVGVAPFDPDDEWFDPPYEVRPSRPWTQLAFRIGLWVAVGFGCLGGILGLLGLTTREGDTNIVQGQAGGGDLPAPVASVAASAVQTWLTAGPGDQELLETLFVEPPAPALITEDLDGEEAAPGGMEIGAVTPVAGGLWEENYWLVTLAVDVHECVPVPEDAETPAEPVAGGRESLVDCAAAEAQADDAEAEDGESDLSGEDSEGEDEGPLEARISTWYVEVGVAGELDERVAVLSTPAVVAAPAEVGGQWQSLGPQAGTAEAGEPIADTVGEFLAAWLTGDAEPDRYVAPGVVAETVQPPPFTSVVLSEIAYDELEEGHVRTRAHVQVSTPGGASLVVAYEVEVGYRDDRWEVLDFWGAPTLSAPPDGGSTESPEPAEQPEQPEGDS